MTERFLFQIAPLVVLVFTMINLTVIPFNNNFIIADLNIGILFILASASISVYGIIIAGWSSGSKYSFLGGLRSASQVLSYEIALGLSLAGVVLMAGSLKLSDIVQAQNQTVFGMYAIPQIIGFIVFVIAAFAETNRAPLIFLRQRQSLLPGILLNTARLDMLCSFLLNMLPCI